MLWHPTSLLEPVFDCAVDTSKCLDVTNRPEIMWTGKDRLIGLDDYQPFNLSGLYDVSQMFWVDRYIVITREKIEGALPPATLQQPTAGMIVPLPLVDGDTKNPTIKLEGAYILYLQIERIQ
jgi:hypothetical protein